MTATPHRRWVIYAEDQERRVTDCAVFLRPEGGGMEWIVADHRTLTKG